MRLDKIYDSLLEEGISPVVYHTTGFQSAIQILTTNRFMMSAAHDAEPEFEISKKLFYMSTSRSKLNPFSETGSSLIGTVTFTLDGRKLGNNLYGRGLDFFGNDTYRRDTKNNTYEFEDRVMSTHPTIENFTSYVKEVSVHIDNEKISGWVNRKDTQAAVMIKKLSDECKKRNIPFGLYNSAVNFSLSKKPIDIDQLIYALNINPESDRYSYLNDNLMRKNDVENAKFYAEDIKLFNAYIYLIRESLGKRFNGKVDQNKVRDLKRMIAIDGGSVVYNIAKLLENKSFIVLPEVRQTVAYLMTRIKQSGQTSYIYINRSIRALREKQ